VLYSSLVLLPKSRGCFDSDIEVAASFSGGGPSVNFSTTVSLVGNVGAAHFAFRVSVRSASAEVRGDPFLYILAAVQDTATKAHEFGAGAGQAVRFEGSL